MERGDTLEWDHAENTSSVDAAACLRLTEFDVVRGFTGADGGTTWKPCIQKEQRAGGWTGGQGQPTAHRWKGEGRVGRGRCRKRGGGRGDYNVKSCTVLPNTKQLITAQKDVPTELTIHTQKDWSKLHIVLWSASWIRHGGICFCLK